LSRVSRAPRSVRSARLPCAPRPSRHPFARSGLRLIRGTMPRFISILLITLLGVSFFYGLRITGPYMQANADDYLNSSNTMDISIVSTLGFDDDDIAAIVASEGLTDSYAGYNANLLVDVEDNGLSSQVLSLDPRGSAGMNVPRLSDGRLPTSPGEILVEPLFVERCGLGIGDEVRFESGTADKLSETIDRSNFTIVGVADAPLFMAEDRGASEIGSGHNSYFFFISEADFALDLRTVVYLRCTEALMAGSRFSSAYEQAVDAGISRLEAAGAIRSPLRYQAVYDEAKGKLDDSRKKVTKGYKKLDDGAAKLDDAYSDLSQGLKKLSDSRAELTRAQNELRKSRDQLDKGWQKLKSSRKTLDDARKKLDSSNKTLQSTQKSLKTAHSKLTAAKKTLDATAISISTGRKQLEQAKAAGLISDDAYALQSQQLKGAETAYQQGLKEYQTNLTAYNNATKKYQSGLTAYRNAHNQLVRGEALYKTSHQQLLDGEKSYKAGMVKYNNGLAAYNSALKKLNSGKQDYLQGLADYKSEKKTALADLAAAQKKIDDGQADLDKLEQPIWYVMSIDDNAGFRSFKTESAQIDSLAYVIPVIFFLIAALVSMTAITRLVDSERSQIGIFKALGYRSGAIALRYLLYALVATLVGALGGLVLGYNIIPPSVFNAFNTLFSIPQTSRPFSVTYAAASCGVAVVAAIVPAMIVVRSAVREAPAEAMRPAAPKVGKRIFLEWFTPLWKRFTFLQKITARNLFRYKKRLLMTVFGVAGCTALTFTGFGLHDALMTVPDKQNGEMLKYDVAIDFKLAKNESLTQFVQKVEASGAVSENIEIFQEAVRMTSPELTKDVVLVVSFDPAKLGDFVTLSERKTGLATPRSFALSDSGVILTEQIARQFGAGEGDRITLRTLENKQAEFTVTGIVENYVLHYVYMTPAVYQAGFGEAVEPNRLLARFSPPATELPQSLTVAEDVSAVTYSADTADNLRDQLDVLTFVVLILILSAAALIFVVLFSLTTINIEERRRELASIEVLGFFDRELAAYIYRENIVITVAGALLGIGLGVLLERYIITSMEIDVFMFSRDLLWPSFVIAVALTFLFSAVVNLLMYRSLTRIDMVESLKAVE